MIYFTEYFEYNVLELVIRTDCSLLQNDVVLLNEQVKFNCSQIYGRFTQWTKDDDLYPGHRVYIATHCNILEPYTDTYAVERIVEMQLDACNLIIPNVTLKHAGTYTCLNGPFDFETFATFVLTVIGKRNDISISYYYLIET